MSPDPSARSSGLARIMRSIIHPPDIPSYRTVDSHPRYSRARPGSEVDQACQ